MAKKKAKKKKRATTSKRVTKKKIIEKKKTAGRKSKKRKSKKKLSRAPSKGPKLPAEPIGRVTHYFPKAKATAVMIERDGIRVGDTLYYKGHTTRFKQTVESLQVNHQPLEQASPGEEVGIQVRSRTREHDLVFKL